MQKLNSKLIKAILLILMLSTSLYAVKTIHVYSWLPPKHTMNANVLPTWGKWIEKATEGRVKIKIEYPGSPKAVLDNVEDGAYEAGWTFHGFFPGRFELTKIVELPNLGVGADKASPAYWKVYNKYFINSNENDGLVLIGLFVHAPGQIHLMKPINSLKQLEGKKIRVGSDMQSKIAKKLGIEAVSLPGNKVYQSLSQGIVEGVFMPMGEKKNLRIKEVAPFTLKFPKGMYLGSFGIYLNSDFLNSLSKKDRQAILSVSGEKLSALAGKYWQDDAKIGEDDAIKYGNNIVYANEDMIKEYNSLVIEFEQKWIQKVSKKGFNGSAALSELRELVK